MRCTNPHPATCRSAWPSAINARGRRSTPCAGRQRSSNPSSTTTRAPPSTACSAERCTPSSAPAPTTACCSPWRARPALRHQRDQGRPRHRRHPHRHPAADRRPGTGHTGRPARVVPFYLNVGYVLGGYLASTVLGLSVGTTPRTARRAGLRIAALAVYSVLLGIAGAVVVGPVLDIWHHDVPTIAAIGALAVFAAAMFASAIQGWLGVAGTALVILLLVVLGNPGSGGIYAPEFLPGCCGHAPVEHPRLANDLTKAAVYFEWRSAGWPAFALALWAVIGGLGLVGASLVRGRRAATSGTRSGPRRPATVVEITSENTLPGRRIAGALQTSGARGYHPVSRTALSFVST
ncbi:hypothetical protein NKG94_29590 [Micromonospora sp. M12]